MEIPNNKLSVTDIIGYTMCPQKFAFKISIEKVDKKGTAALFGSMMHRYMEQATLAFLNRGYISQFILDDTIDLFNFRLGKPEYNNDELYTSEDILQMYNLCNNEVENLVSAYENIILENKLYKPLGETNPSPKEEKTKIETAVDNVKLSMVVDFMGTNKETKEQEIIDFKFTGSMPKGDNYGNTLQLGMYALAFPKTKKVHNKYFVTTVKNKTRKYIIENSSKELVGKNPEGLQEVPQGKDMSQEKTYRIVSLLVKQILETKVGEFYPNKYSFLCSEKYCAFWSECTDFWG
jgi:hypothetical protein